MISPSEYTWIFYLSLRSLLSNRNIVSIDDFDMMILPFDTGSFNGAFSIAALMHLTEIDISKAIRDIHRVLANDGIFYFSVSLERNDVDRRNNLDSAGRDIAWGNFLYRK